MENQSEKEEIFQEYKADLRRKLAEYFAKTESETIEASELMRIVDKLGDD